MENCQKSSRNKIVESLFKFKEYEEYADVPIFRRQWFFWLLLLVPSLTNVYLGNPWYMNLLEILTLSGCFAIIVFGNAYYKRRGKVCPFNIFNRGVSFLIVVGWMINAFRNVILSVIS
ncbi:hypothetical protein AAEX28_06825 [Lentisphaerota bacterium WC36G]|nr:hypothetical protein LJT99_09690 [Lentisphaerae bacterium WC36]UDQ97770.1 hypothetical protein LJT99_15140 [Lentisphaerae bacterium WC36]UDQ99433.1 hypothetical protein LJT99_07790 [Lentisphaerae bacterium WC36]